MKICLPLFRSGTQGTFMTWNAPYLMQLNCHRSCPSLNPQSLTFSSVVTTRQVDHLRRHPTIPILLQIRLFGDPLVDGGQIPVQQLGVQVSILSNSSLILRHSAQDVYCDFVSGYAFGDCIGISLQSVSGWLTVNDVRVQGKTKVQSSCMPF